MGAVQASTSNAKLVNSEVIVNIHSTVRPREHRKLHHSIDANSYTTMFNLTPGPRPGRVGMGLTMLLPGCSQAKGTVVIRGLFWY